MLHHEDMGVEVGEPQPALRRHVEGVDGLAEKRLDLGPEEAGIVIGHVGRRAVAQELVDADLLELVEQRIELAGVERIAELADEVGGAHERRLGVGRGMIGVVRHRKARQLDVARQAVGIDQRIEDETFAHADLGAVDVVGREGRVGGARGSSIMSPLALATNWCSVSARQMPRR